MDSVWNPLDLGGSLSFRIRNSVDSTLEAAGSRAESIGFKVGIQWILILITMLSELDPVGSGFGMSVSKLGSSGFRFQGSGFENKDQQRQLN